MFNFIVISIISFVSFIILLCLHKHYTASFGILLNSVLNVIISIFSIFLIDELIYKILSIICCVIFYSIYIYFLWYKTHKKNEDKKLIPYLDFSKRILSISLLFNNFSNLLTSNKDSRIIGKILPYNHYQLKYNNKIIQQNEISAAGATLISGSMGSGKTYGMKSLIKQNIVNGNSIIFAEYKGDSDLVNELSNYSKKYGYEVYKIEKGISNFNYDPLKNINNVGRIEAIMNMRKWDISGSDAHYKTGVQLLLQKTISSFSHIYNTNKEYNNSNESFTLSYYKYLKEYHPEKSEWDAYETINKLIELLLTSSLKDMFNNKNNKTLDFRELKNKKYLCIISFVSSNKELATSFSSLLFKDLLDECTINTPNKNIYLYIDEFATLENPFIIKDIIEKGRSGKIATTLALQDINQIIIQTNEAYLNSILGTINTFIIYSGATRITAEKFAGVQLHDIENVLMNLRKPINGKSPTAIYISKYPTINKNITSEVFRFKPYIFNKQINDDSIKNIANNDIIGNSDNMKELYNNNVCNDKIDKSENENLNNSNLLEINQDAHYDDFI